MKDDEQDLESAPVESKKMRFIEPVMTPYLVRTEQTVAAGILGVHSEAERMLFYLGVKEKMCTNALWIAWFLGVAVGLLVLADVLPVAFVYCSFLSLPLPLIAFFLLSTDLVRIILHEMEFYIIMTLQVVLITHAFMHFTHLGHADGLHEVHAHWDNKCIAIICFIPSMIVSGFLDAYPAKWRAVFEILFYSGSICVFVAWNSMIMFGEHGSWAPVTSHIGDNLTLLLFYIRHIWCAVHKPELLVMIKSDVDTVREVLTYSTGEDGKLHIERNVNNRQEVQTVAKSRHSALWSGRKSDDVAQ